MSTSPPRGGGRGIPIPSSFASPPIQEKAGDAETIDATWCSEHLLVAEHFLFLQFKKSALLPLDDFYAVARKAYQQIRSNQVAEADDSKKPAALLPPKIDPLLQDLSEEERLLYHLVAATAPVLYRLCAVPEKELHAWSPTADKMRKVYCLESIPTDNSRRIEFKKLLQKRTVDKSVSDEILTMIRQHREEAAARGEKQPAVELPEQQQKSTTKPVVLAAEEALIRPGMNLEERVRARAAAREKDLMSKHHQAMVEGSSSYCVDQEWLVRLADALWSYCCTSNLVNSDRSFHRRPSSPSNKKPAVRCWTLGDVVGILRGSTGKGVGKHEKASKRQIVSSLIELSEKFPQWISIISDDNSKVPGKDAVVKIKPVDYPSIRSQLDGKNNSASKKQSKAAGAVNSLLHPPRKQPLANKVKTDPNERNGERRASADRAVTKGQAGKVTLTKNRVENSNSVVLKETQQQSVSPNTGTKRALSFISQEKVKVLRVSPQAELGSNNN